VKAMHDKTATRIQQICPNCKKSKMIQPAKPDEPHPRKNYCIECGHEWWEFDKRAVQHPDSRGV
jgi:Zn ribbon nucleic-acid-binding protein